MRIWILKFAVVFYFMTIGCTVVWERFVDGNIYDCTDPLFGYLYPDGWVGGNNFPVEAVDKVVSGRSPSEPDELKKGWNIAGLWVLWGSFFASSLIVSFALARLPWPENLARQSREQHRTVPS
jgi:hypothetical protein